MAECLQVGMRLFIVSVFQRQEAPERFGEMTGVCRRYGPARLYLWKRMARKIIRACKAKGQFTGPKKRRGSTLTLHPLKEWPAIPSWQAISYCLMIKRQLLISRPKSP